MAKIYSEEELDELNFGMPLSIKRTNALPLDYSSIYKTKEEADAYASSNPTAYVGQIIVANEDDEPKAYIIKNTDGELEEIGSNITGLVFDSYDAACSYATTNPKAYVGQMIVVADADEDEYKAYIIKNSDGELEAVGSDYEGISADAYLKVSKTGRVVTLTATDTTGTTTVTVTDGKNGTDGKDGEDGISPYINSDGYWVVNNVATNIPAQGEKGETGEGFKINYVYSTIEERDADAENVEVGEMVVVSDGGRLFLKSEDGWVEIGDFSSMTTIKGDKGDPGDNGATPIPTLGDNGVYYWYVNGENTGIRASGIKGDTGDEGYSPIVTASSENGITTVSTSYKDNSGQIKYCNYRINNGGVNITNTIDSANNCTKITFGYVDGSGVWQTKTFNAYNGISPTLSSQEISDGIKRFSYTNYTRNADGNVVVDNTTSGYVDINVGYAPTIDVSTPQANLTKIDITDKDATHSVNLSSAEISVSEKVNGRVTITTKDGVNGEKSVVIMDAENAYDDSEIIERLDSLEETVEGITGFEISIVTTLPSQGQKGYIYLISDGNNAYDEYIWIGDKFELLGTTKIDLTDYVKDTDYASQTKAGVVKVDNNTITIDSNGVIRGVAQTPLATTSATGTVIPDGTSIGVDSTSKISIKVSEESNNILVKKTDGLYVGKVQVDGTTVTMDDNGVLHAETKGSASAESGNTIVTKDDGLYVPTATNSTLGSVMVDNTSISAINGKIAVKISDSTNNALDVDDSGLVIPTATDEQYGTVILDNSTVGINNNGKTEVKIGSATDNLIKVKDGGIALNRSDNLAKTSVAGFVIPDNDTITIDGNGKITSTIGANSISYRERNLIQLIRTYESLSVLPDYGDTNVIYKIPVDASDEDTQYKEYIWNGTQYVDTGVVGDGGEDGLYIDEDDTVPIATYTDEGKVKPDNNTIVLSNPTDANDGTIKVNTEVIATQENIYDLSLTIDSVDMTIPTLESYTEEELFDIIWDELSFEAKEAYTTAELDAILDEIDFSGIGGGGSGSTVTEMTADDVTRIWNAALGL